ncbi:Uncharacterized protein QTN25_002201 [Entamoeba marina]
MPRQKPTTKYQKKHGERPNKTRQQKQDKHKQESKPKKVQQITKYNAPSKHKTKPSKSKSSVVVGSKSDGRNALTSSQIKQKKMFSQYSASAKKIKQLRRQGVPMSVIQNDLNEKRKAQKRKQKKQNKKFGLD